MRVIAKLAVRLARDAGGAAMMEFALALPLVLAMGGYGVELSNLALTNLRVNQIALTLADNASRIGVRPTCPAGTPAASCTATFQLREYDLDDVLEGARRMGDSIHLTTYGRVTVSSLENIQRGTASGTPYSPAHADDAKPFQRIHWQRCIGLRGQPANGVPDPGFDSSYGSTATGSGASAVDTQGTDASYENRGVNYSDLSTPPPVTPPAGTAVIFVEVNYQYQPLFGTMFGGTRKLRYVASLIVRDNRDLTMIYNPAPTVGATPARATCVKHTTTLPTS